MLCFALFITQSQPLSLYSSDLFKTLSPGYYCQTASAAPPRTDSPVPSDSGIYSPPTSILPFLEVTILIFSRKVPHAITPWLVQDQEDLLPKLMKPKENWNETNEAINKVWPNLLIKGWIGHILKALCYCNVRQTKQLFSYDECDNIFLHQVETSVWAEIWNQD